MALADELKSFLFSSGASLVGFANLLEISPDIRDYLPFGISIGVALDTSVVSGISEGPTREYHEDYLRVNRILEGISKSTIYHLGDKGYTAKVLPVTIGEDIKTLSTRLPHKTIATRAGIGWIGKCALLVTEEYGSAIRLVSVLTNAPITTDRPINTSRCGDCTVCVDICPAQSLTGKNWEMGVPRDSLVDVFKCRSKARDLTMKSFGISVSICGRCIVACPWTQKYIKRSD